MRDEDQRYIPTDFSKIRVGVKTLDDATVVLGDFKKINPRFGDKENVLKAINFGDVPKMRQISNFFYKTSGIYNRLCKYVAYLYKYDWFITPYINQCTDLIKDQRMIEEKGQDQKVVDTTKQKKKIFSNFFKVLKYFETTEIKRLLGQIALKTIRNGCYYGYLILKNDRAIIQQLPVSYCRTRFKVNNRDAIEFNMHYFYDLYSDEQQRQKIVSLFPKDFQRGYNLFKNNKLPPCFQGDQIGWYLLQTKNTIKFNLNGQDFPFFIAAVPALIDLNQAQDLDRKKMAQRLIKILIQKMPLDKNGELVFDVDQAQQLHNNAVKMLSRAIGIDVLTTFADVSVEDMADKNTTTTTDELLKVQRTAFNEAGTPQQVFNSSGNIALQYSITNDEAALTNLLSQFQSFLNILLQQFNKTSKYYYHAQILTTTVYNYKDLAKMYKEQAQMGYSKMLPQIALGQTQSSVLANAYFENDVLDLVRVFIPPLTSNTMNAEALQARRQQPNDNNNAEERGAGRPQMEQTQKSDKTIANQQAK